MRYHSIYAGVKMPTNGTLKSILITIIGTLLLIISAWAGGRIRDHGARLNGLESGLGQIKVLLGQVNETNRRDHVRLSNQLDRLRWDPRMISPLPPPAGQQ